MWQYDQWTWEFEDGRYIYDKGCKGQQALAQQEDWSSKFGLNPSPHSEQNTSYIPDNIATENAVAAAFQWAATEIDESSRSIFAHPWIGAGAFPQQDEPLIDSHPPSFSEEVKKRVGTWRQECASGTDVHSDVDIVLHQEDY